MKRKYDLSDVGKALRIVLTYAATLEPATVDGLLSPLHAAKDAPARGREEGDFSLRKSQRDWLQAATKRRAHALGLAPVPRSLRR